MTLDAIGDDESIGVFISGEYFSILMIAVFVNIGVLVEVSSSAFFGVLVFATFGVLAGTFLVDSVLVVMGVSDLAAFGVLVEVTFGVFEDAGVFEAFGVLVETTFGVFEAFGDFLVDFAAEAFLVIVSFLLTGV